MSEFESWKQYGEFSHFVMRKARHIRDAKNQRFLDTVVETSTKRKRVFVQGAVLWRAQLGNDWKTETVGEENAHSDDVDQSIRFDADQIGAKRRKALSV